MLVKPRFGRRRCSGICPPSKPGWRLKPERDFCPFSPRAAVLPCPEPGPRPTRFFAWREPFFGLRLFSSMGRLLLDYFDEVRDLGDHSAHFFRIGALRDAVHLAEPESLEGLAHFDRAGDAAADLAHAKGLRRVVF